MNLQERITLLAETIANDVEQLLSNDGTLANLTTTAKSSLVDAINEIAAASPTGVLLANQNLADLLDAATARTNLGVNSSAETSTEITTAIAAVTLGALGGLTQAEVDARVQVIVDTAPAALDTLNELAAAIGNDENFAATINTALGNRVRFDAAQTLTAAQKTQACDNIGVGEPDHDFAADYIAERDA